MKEAYQEMRR